MRFQWLRSTDAEKFEAIPGATQPNFYPNPDDLGAIIAARAPSGVACARPLPPPLAANNVPIRALCRWM